MTIFNLTPIASSWQSSIQTGLQQINPDYLAALSQNQDWLPGPDKIFNAFSLPLLKVNYILFGESPYPRAESANGYAFWDANVNNLWAETGLSKTVNRATSLRNIMKMLLIAEGLLEATDTSQEAIARLPKHELVQTGAQLFTNFINQGILLLNATPVLQPSSPLKDAKHWLPFMEKVLQHAIAQKPCIQFILLGKIANTIDHLIPNPSIKRIYAEHPYNLSFIHNKDILSFFGRLNLLRAKQGTA